MSRTGRPRTPSRARAWMAAAVLAAGLHAGEAAAQDEGDPRALAETAMEADRRGDYVRAEAALLRLIAVQSDALGDDHPEVGLSRGALCNVYEHMGDDARAEPLCAAAVQSAERAFGPRDARTAAAVSNFAMVSQNLGKFTQAELLYSRALDIQGSRGPQNREIPNALHSLGSLYLQAKDKRAEALLLKALKAAERILGADSLDTANALNSLGVLYSGQNRHADAEASFRRAISILERHLGPDHPRLGKSHLNLGVLQLRAGDLAASIDSHTRGAAIEEKSLELVLAGGSEAQKRAFMRTVLAATDGIVSIHAVAAPTDPRAARLALVTVLQRKGRVLDAMSSSLASLRGRLGPEERALLDQLDAVRGAMAAAVLGGGTSAEGAAAAARMEAEAQRLESALGARSLAFRAASAPVTLESVAAAIPEGAVLLEIASYRPVDVRRENAGFQPPHYMAYALDHAGAVRWVELGPAAAIDALARDFNKALATRSPGARAAARALDEKVGRPLRGIAEGARTWLVSPDGALNLVAFAALVDEDDGYLVERFGVSYLTSGRDLLRRAARSEPRGGALVVANPDFGPPGAAPAVRGDLSTATFTELPGTGEEAAALATILGDARVVTRGGADRASLLAARGPRVLHVATHGFFLPDVPPAGDAAAPPLAAAPEKARGFDLEDAPRIDNPLLRSGLVLAGANRHDPADGRGIVTALEASGLDLQGTRLVTLSACETGLGDVKSGDGVYGLRRALVMAGAETQVMSLWKVDDAATRDLMVGYYRALQAGGERASSMRTIQLAMRADPRTEHPFYWASFIVSGDPASFDGTLTPLPRAVAAGPGPVAPGARGCGCELAGDATSGGPTAALAGAALLLLAARRRREGRSLQVSSRAREVS